MRIVFLASGHFALPTLQWLAGSEHEIVAIVTQPARPAGRGRRTTRTPVRAVADELGLTVLEPEDVNAPDCLRRLGDCDAHIGLTIAFGQKLGRELLSLFSGGCINLHASLLPKYRGAAPINWAIVRGEERTGVTVFRLVERMDAGPILTVRETAIRPRETAAELHDRLADLGVDAVRSALEACEAQWVRGATEPRPAGAPQAETDATKAPKLQKSDGHVDFDRPAVAIANQILGMTPWPGARARYEASDGRYEDVLLLRAIACEKGEDGRSDSAGPTAAVIEPGVLDERLFVAAADGFVRILEIKPSSGRTISWQDFVNGRHVAPGDRFRCVGSHPQ